MTRVLVVDDHILIRAGIRLLLEKIPSVQVVAEASNGQEALQLSASFQPDIALMDIAMPDMNGVQATEQLRKLCPDIRVIILSMYGTEEHILQALKAGAHGYILKSSLSQELANAVQKVQSGNTYLTPGLSDQITNYLHKERTRGSANPLSARQQEVLQMIAQGNSTKDISMRLNISVKTVESHRAQLMSRLKIRDIPNLVRYAIRSGLVSLE